MMMEVSGHDDDGDCPRCWRLAVGRWPLVVVVGRWLLVFDRWWLVGWLVGWLAGWVAGWLADWLLGWLVGWLGSWLVG